MTTMTAETSAQDREGEKDVKKLKTKTKHLPAAEQYSLLQEACRQVMPLLKRKGIIIPESSIKTIGEGQPDSKTGAMVTNARATVAFLLTHFAGLSHWVQRKTFHHTKDPIYQRLIVAILKGYYIPPLRVAAVATEGVVQDPNVAEDWTLIDGLQRTTCYIIAVLMAALGDELVEMGCVDKTVWTEIFQKPAAACDINELLSRQQQMEVFYKIDLKGVLHFMLLLNGAQRQMSTKIQLELMNIPLVKLLEQQGIHLVKEQERAPDHKMEKASFKASNLIVAVQGYLQKNPQVKTEEEKEDFLSAEGEYLTLGGDMSEVIAVLQIVTGPLHKAVLSRLDSTVLSEGEVFTTALMAAAGKYVDMTSFEQLLAALKRLLTDVESGKDVLALEDYGMVYAAIKSGRGRKIRSIICAAFLEYFRGNCKQLEWEENARVYA